MRMVHLIYFLLTQLKINTGQQCQTSDDVVIQKCFRNCCDKNGYCATSTDNCFVFSTKCDIDNNPSPCKYRKCCNLGYCANQSQTCLVGNILIDPDTDPCDLTCNDCCEPGEFGQVCVACTQNTTLIVALTVGTCGFLFFFLIGFCLIWKYCPKSFCKICRKQSVQPEQPEQENVNNINNEIQEKNQFDPFKECGFQSNQAYYNKKQLKIKDEFQREKEIPTIVPSKSYIINEFVSIKQQHCKDQE